MWHLRLSDVEVTVSLGTFGKISTGVIALPSQHLMSSLELVIPTVDFLMNDERGHDATHSDRSSAWTQYWHTGALHSLPGTIDLSQDTTARRFWSAAFSGLDPNSRILDIGSGNGPLARLLVELYDYELRPHLDAVDLSEVAPPWLSTVIDPQGKLRFHSRTCLEELPFTNDTFSLVVSQYGFEYGDAQRGCREVARVLQPEGRIILLMHDAGSRLAAVARSESESIRWLLREDGTLDRARDIYTIAASHTVAGARLSTDEAVRRRVEAVLLELRARAAHAAIPDVLVETHNLIVQLVQHCRAQASAVAACQAHDRYRQQLAHALLRSSELCEAALDPERLRDLQTLLQEAGIETQAVGPLHHDNGALLGCTLLARKRS